MEIKKAIARFLEELKESEAFKDYEYQKQRVNQVAGLKEKIHEYQDRRFEFQSYSGEDLFEKIDEFDREYQSFAEDPVVRDYLAAELEICRLVQEINDAITDLVDIDVDIL